MSQSNTTTIPAGSWVLVTGATGFVASHIVLQFLERGYKVRGTVRDLNSASWLKEDVFKPYASSGYIELVQVPDLGVEGAFDEAVKGVTAVVHVATIIPDSPDPNIAIPKTVAGVTSLMEAAAKESSVKIFVYTSSTAATTTFLPGDVTRVERDTFNEAVVQLAWTPPYTPDRIMVVYGASKVAAEKAVWKFVEEKRPSYSVRVVVPSGIAGAPLNEKHTTSSSNWFAHAYHGNVQILEIISAAYVIDVKDVALLHVAAALGTDLDNVRLQAWGPNSDWNQILAIMRSLDPQHKFIDDFPDPSPPHPTTDLALAESLLKKWGPQDGWKPLEQTVADNIKPLIKAAET